MSRPHFPSPGPMILYPSERRAERRRVGQVTNWLNATGFGWLSDGTYGRPHGETVLTGLTGPGLNVCAWGSRRCGKLGPYLCAFQPGHDGKCEVQF